jgi:subtilase family serine protease
MNLLKWGPVAFGLAIAMAGVGPAAAQSERAQLELSGRTFHKAVCARGNPAGTARCFAHVVTDARGNVKNGKPTPNATTPSGYGPADIQAAYSIPAGSGSPTIAIVDAYGYSAAESDLAAYRSQFGLPPCTKANGCLRIVNQSGGTKLPREDTGWAQEQALDLDMASAACPNCKILLIQASSASISNGRSGRTAVDAQASRLRSRPIRIAFRISNSLTARA